MTTATKGDNMTITFDVRAMEQRASRNAGAALLLIEALAWVESLSPADRHALQLANELLESDWSDSGSELARMAHEAQEAGDYDPEYLGSLLENLGWPPAGCETIIEYAVIGVLAGRPKLGEHLRIAMERGWSYSAGAIVPNQRTAS